MNTDIVILSRNQELLQTAVSSIVKYVPHDKINRCIVGWNAKEPLGKIDSGGIPVEVVWETSTFNFSRLNNYIVQFYSDAEAVLLMNDDVTLVEDSISPCLSLVERPEVGAVGIKLLFPDGRIQHAGVFMSVKDGKFAGVGHVGFKQPDQAMPDIQATAVTGAFMMVRRSLWNSIGGLDEGYESCFQDVQFCWSATLLGKMNVCLNTTHAIHAESVTRNQYCPRHDVERICAQAEEFLGKLKEKEVEK